MSSDFCSVQLQTERRKKQVKTPLEQYNRRGYVQGDGPEAKALDAAISLTASTWGPPFSTSSEEADGEWWFPAYESAMTAVETAIVEGVLVDGR